MLLVQRARPLLVAIDAIDTGVRLGRRHKDRCYWAHVGGLGMPTPLRVKCGFNLVSSIDSTFSGFYLPRGDFFGGLPGLSGLSGLPGLSEARAAAAASTNP